MPRHVLAVDHDDNLATAHRLAGVFANLDHVAHDLAGQHRFLGAVQRAHGFHRGGNGYGRDRDRPHANGRRVGGRLLVLAAARKGPGDPHGRERGRDFGNVTSVHRVVVPPMAISGTGFWPVAKSDGSNGGLHVEVRLRLADAGFVCEGLGIQQLGDALDALREAVFEDSHGTLRGGNGALCGCQPGACFLHALVRLAHLELDLRPVGALRLGGGGPLAARHA